MNVGRYYKTPNGYTVKLLEDTGLGYIFQMIDNLDDYHTVPNGEKYSVSKKAYKDYINKLKPVGRILNA